ncbi:dbf4-dependent protein kinase hsk1 [Moniliophthora roreri]|nr:dbf4-dependent protein kinase hsk1 [Moniliophthora roreri]
MATILLSQHSSNPLERCSSDVRPGNMFSGLLNKQTAPSSDSIKQENYIKHINAVIPSIKFGQDVPIRTKSTVCVDQDEDMDEEDDELIIVDDDERQVEKTARAKAKVASNDRYSDVMEGFDEELDRDVDGEANDEQEEEGQRQSGDDIDVASDDEENTLSRKPPEEQEEIMAEIADLEAALGPQLTEDYKLLDRLGTGTFSSVYKAIDLYYHTKWDNTPWHGRHPPHSSAHYQSLPRPQGFRVYVAIKRIYVTSSPERIKNEISILDECRSCRHVSQLITAFREKDQVVVVMPYQRNDDFREYFTEIPMLGIKSYFRCLFRALRDIHARGIIHRDLKPANFLFDPRTGIGTLCDFGLACRMEPSSQHSSCVHTPPTAENPHGKLKDKKDYDVEEAKKASKESRYKSGLPPEKVGYPEKDPRPHSKANRAGTRGFRAPEVLLKCSDQTGAIDMWSAGMILLFFLTHKFPLFQSNDDVEALMEIAVIIGRRQMERVATLHGRIFATNVPSLTHDGMSWEDFVQKQNSKLYTPPEPNVNYYPYSKQLHDAQQRRLERVDADTDADVDADTEADDDFDEHPGSAISSPPSALSINTRLDSSGTSSLAFPTSPPKTLSSPEVSPTTPVRRTDKQRASSGLSSQDPDFALKAPSKKSHEQDVKIAFDLLEKLMHPLSTSRITPRQALYHPFLWNGKKREDRMKSGRRSRTASLRGGQKVASEFIDLDEDMEDEIKPNTSSTKEDNSTSSDEETELSDDEFVPHPFGKGVCANYHFRDAVTEEPCVQVYADEDDTNAGGNRKVPLNRKMEVVRLVSGEGVAIGKQPCEYHEVGYDLDMTLIG